jgi:hypothetical protein
VLDHPDLRGKLATLGQLGLIYAKALQPEPTYAFKHALTREVAYGSLLHQVKKQLHQAIGEALESRHAERLDAHSLLTVLCRPFHAWDIPVWQRMCAQTLDTLYPRTRHCIPDTPAQPLLPGLQKGQPTPVEALTELLCTSDEG